MTASDPGNLDHLSSPRLLDEPESWTFLNMPKVKPSKGSSSTRTSEEGSFKEKLVPCSDPRFVPIARKNGVLLHDGDCQPKNIKNIVSILNQPRDSPGPGQQEFRKYDGDIKRATNEKEIGYTILSLLKRYGDNDYASQLDRQLVNFPKAVGLNDGLSPPKPDFSEGYVEDVINPHLLSPQIVGAIVPTQGESSIALSHFVGEFKKLGGDIVLGSRQAAYDAASLVYSRGQALLALEKENDGEEAYVASFVCDGERLQLSVHFVRKAVATAKISYHQYIVFDGNIRLDLQNFLNGRRRLLNLRDWAKDNAALFRKELKSLPQESAHSGKQPTTKDDSKKEAEVENSGRRRRKR